MMNIKRKLSFVLTAVFAAAILAGCAASDNTPVVKTAAVQKTSIQTELIVSGVLLPKNTVSVSGKLTGNVLAVNAEVGGTIKKGDTLVMLETKQLSAQLAQAEAALKQANAAVKSAKSSASSASSAVKAVQGNAATAKINYDAAKAAYNSIKALHDAGLATDAALQEAKIKYDVAKSQYDTLNGPTTKQAKYSSSAASNNINTAQAAVAVAEANVASLLVQMENANVLSPVDGVVATKSINAGELAAAGAPLMTIIETDTLKLKGTVSQSMLPLLTEGQEIKVSVDIYPEKEFTGKVTMIAPIAVTTGEYFPIEISIPGEAGLKPGLSAHAQASLKSPEHLSVPASAIVANNGQSYVYLLDGATAKRQAVTVGVQGGGYAEILNGLSEGQEVIISHTDILSDKMPVRK